MNLSLKSFSQLVQDMGAALQSSATALVDISAGSVARALFEANAGIALWMQWLIIQVLQTARASTSTGNDLDSWMADFGLSRLPASASTGLVTFSRYTTNLAASIPVGATVKAGDGSLSFSVVASPSLSTWDAASASYVLPIGISSGSVPVVCNQPGVQGNVVAGSVSMLASSLRGIDQVINPTALVGGRDAEADGQFRTRFVDYLGSLSRGTDVAIRSAVSNVQQGITMSLIENSSPSGEPAPGQFFVVVDDGSGYPSSRLLAQISDAVETVRPLGTTAAVLAPIVVPVDVSLNIYLAKSDPQYARASALIQQALADYFNNLSIGKGIPISRVIQIVYSAVPGIQNVTGVMLNGSGQDVNVGLLQVAKAGRMTVTINAD